MRAIFVAALAAMWFSAQAIAQDAPFSFMGHVIGEELSKWKGKLEIDGITSSCKKPSAHGIKHCKDISLTKEKSMNKIGPLLVAWLYWDFLDEKLIGFQLATYQGEYSTVFDMTSGKYGPPIFQKNYQATWDTLNGPLELYAQRVSGTPYVFLELRDSSAKLKIAERDAKIREATGAAGKKLF